MTQPAPPAVASEQRPIEELLVELRLVAATHRESIAARDKAETLLRATEREQQRTGLELTRIYAACQAALDRAAGRTDEQERED